MIEQGAIDLIDKIGAPIAAFVMMYALYVQNQKWQQKNQEKNEARFDSLVNNFINAMKDVAEKHSAALQKQSEAISKNTECMAANTEKLNEHIRQKDEFMDFIKDERRAKAGG